MQTESYRKQHDALRNLIAEFPDSAAAVDEAKMRGLMVKFIGQLRAHLAMEDTYLYPTLIKHEDKTVREKAERFQLEMGTLAKSLDDFYSHWARAGMITANTAGFVEEWIKVRSALSNRISREDSDLYDLVDRTVALRRSA